MGLDTRLLFGQLMRHLLYSVVNSFEEGFGFTMRVHFNVIAADVNVDALAGFLCRKSELDTNRLHLEFFELADSFRDIAGEFIGVLGVTEFKIYTHIEFFGWSHAGV
jgi:hypothetical protein